MITSWLWSYLVTFSLLLVQFNFVRSWCYRGKLGTTKLMVYQIWWNECLQYSIETPPDTHHLDQSANLSLDSKVLFYSQHQSWNLLSSEAKCSHRWFLLMLLNQRYSVVFPERTHSWHGSFRLKWRSVIVTEIERTYSQCPKPWYLYFLRFCPFLAHKFK